MEQRDDDATAAPTAARPAPEPPRAAAPAPQRRPPLGRLVAARRSRGPLNLSCSSSRSCGSCPTFGLLVVVVPRPAADNAAAGGGRAQRHRSQLTLDNYRDVLDDAAIVALVLEHGAHHRAGHAPGRRAIAALAAYAFAWIAFPGRDWLFLVVVALLVVPLQVALIPVAQLYGGSASSATSSASSCSTSRSGCRSAIFLLRNFFAGIPGELLEAARIDGAGEIRIFRRVVLPLGFPGHRLAGDLPVPLDVERPARRRWSSPPRQPPLTVAIRSRPRQFGLEHRRHRARPRSCRCSCRSSCSSPSSATSCRACSPAPRSSAATQPWLTGTTGGDPVEQLVEVRPPAPGGEAGEGRGPSARSARARPGRARPVQHAEVPVPPGRVHRLGVEHEVVVGQLDRADPPPRERRLHRHFELADRSLLVVTPHPRIGDRGSGSASCTKYGVWHATASAHAATARSSGSSPFRPEPRRRLRSAGSAGDVQAPDARRAPSPTIATTVVDVRRALARMRPLRTGAGRAGAPARSSSRSISTHSTPRLSANTRACGLMRVATNTPRVGARLGSRSRRSWYRSSCSTPGDLADALDLHHDRAVVAVAAQQVDRADVGRVLAPHQPEVVAQRGDPAGEELLELRLHPVLGEARVVTEFHGVLVHDLVQLDHEGLARRASCTRCGRRPPAPSTAGSSS